MAIRSGHQLAEESVEIIGEAEKAMRKLLSVNVHLAEIPDSEKKARAVLQTSAAIKHRGSDTFVGIVLDPAQLGESVTAPHLRLPPMDQTTVKAWAWLPTAVPENPFKLGSQGFHVA